MYIIPNGGAKFNYDLPAPAMAHGRNAGPRGTSRLVHDLVADLLRCWYVARHARDERDALHGGVEGVLLVHLVWSKSHLSSPAVSHPWPLPGSSTSFLSSEAISLNAAMPPTVWQLSSAVP